MIKRTGLAALLLGLVACGPGSSYDGLTGGSKEDQALSAPRPISPLSVSFLSTSRPRLTWELAGDATGAIVELCRTRACDGDVKRYEAKGRELAIPEDLEPGIWFWRLTGRTDKTHGTTTSPTWEMLVRGPAAHGSSDAPTGALVDYDGDGKPDLLMVADISDLDGAGTPGPLVIGMHGTDGSSLEDDRTQMFPSLGPPTKDTVLPFSIAGGVDLDGDGFADMAFASATASDGAWVQVEYGGASAFDLKKEGWADGLMRTMPMVREAGDVDGDGYGDLFTSDSQNLSTHLGGAKGVASIVPLIDTVDLPAGVLPKQTDVYARALAVGGGFDSNADSFSDIAFGFPTAAKLPYNASTLTVDRQPALHGGLDSASGSAAAAALPNMIVAAGGVDRFANPNGKYGALSVPNIGSLPVALAFAAGDFNGDGIADVAGTVQTGKTRHVCVWFGDVDRVVDNGACVVASADDALLGEALTAGDLEGDGVDELLAMSSSGVKVLRFADGALRAAEAVPNLAGALTTVWPGRPGKARWAARAADGNSVEVFEGTDLVQTIRQDPDIARGFGRALR